MEHLPDQPQGADTEQHEQDYETLQRAQYHAQLARQHVPQCIVEVVIGLGDLLKELAQRAP